MRTHHYAFLQIAFALYALAGCDSTSRHREVQTGSTSFRQSYDVIAPMEGRPKVGDPVAPKPASTESVSFKRGAKLKDVLSEVTLHSRKNVVLCVACDELTLAEDYHGDPVEAFPAVARSAGLTSLIDGSVVYVGLQDSIQTISSKLWRPYSGKIISLDVANTSVDNLLHILSNVSGKRFERVGGPEKSVTLALIDVPWDQAFDVARVVYDFEVQKGDNEYRVTTPAASTGAPSTSSSE